MCKTSLQRHHFIILLFLFITSIYGNNPSNAVVSSDATKCFAAGLLGGFAGTCIYAPFGYGVNRQLLEQPFKLRHSLRGLPALMIDRPFVYGIQGGGNYFFTRILLHLSTENEPSESQKAFAAILAGGLSGIVGNLGELVALHQQNKGTAIVQTINEFPRGPRSLMRAWAPAMAQEIAFNSARVSLFPTVFKQIQMHTDNKALATTLGIAAATGVTLAITHPFLVVKALMDNDITREKYTDMHDAIKKRYAHNGFRGFYTGGLIRCGGIASAIYLFTTVETYLLQNL